MHKDNSFLQLKLICFELRLGYNYIVFDKDFKFIIFCCFLSFAPYLLFSKGKVGHGNDILYVLYGYQDENELESRGTDKEKMGYYIVRDALAFAIDEQGMGKTENEWRQLKEKVSKTEMGSKINLPSYSEFPSLGGGSHRAYNHQGFYFDYRDEEDKYLKRWELGRDKILIPCVSAAFDIPLGDYRAEALSIIFYYIHMLGDLYEGTDRSVSQLFPIATHWFLLSGIQSDEEHILNNNYGKPRNIFMDEMMYNSFVKIKRSVSHARSRKSAFDLTVLFFKNELRYFINSLIGDEN